MSKELTSVEFAEAVGYRNFMYLPQNIKSLISKAHKYHLKQLEAAQEQAYNAGCDDTHEYYATDRLHPDSHADERKLLEYIDGLDLKGTLQRLERTVDAIERKKNELSQQKSTKGKP